MSPEEIVSLGWALKDLGAFGGLGLIVWLLLTGRVVTRGHLNDVVASERAQTAKAEAREAEWARLAKRGADEIIPPLVIESREHARERFRELQEPR